MVQAGPRLSLVEQEPPRPVQQAVNPSQGRRSVMDLLGGVFDTAVKICPSMHSRPSLARERKATKAWPSSRGWPGSRASRGHHPLCLCQGEDHLPACTPLPRHLQLLVYCPIESRC